MNTDQYIAIFLLLPCNKCFRRIVQALFPLRREIPRRRNHPESGRFVVYRAPEARCRNSRRPSGDVPERQNKKSSCVKVPPLKSLCLIFRRALHAEPTGLFRSFSACATTAPHAVPEQKTQLPAPETKRVLFLSCSIPPRIFPTFRTRRRRTFSRAVLSENGTPEFFRGFPAVRPLCTPPSGGN